MKHLDLFYDFSAKYSSNKAGYPTLDMLTECFNDVGFATSTATLVNNIMYSVLDNVKESHTYNGNIEKAYAELSDIAYNYYMFRKVSLESANKIEAERLIRQLECICMNGWKIRTFAAAYERYTDKVVFYVENEQRIINNKNAFYANLENAYQIASKEAIAQLTDDTQLFPVHIDKMMSFEEAAEAVCNNEEISDFLYYKSVAKRDDCWQLEDLAVDLATYLDVISDKNYSIVFADIGYDIVDEHIVYIIKVEKEKKIIQSEDEWRYSMNRLKDLVGNSVKEFTNAVENKYKDVYTVVMRYYDQLFDHYSEEILSGELLLTKAQAMQQAKQLISVAKERYKDALEDGRCKEKDITTIKVGFDYMSVLFVRSILESLYED